MNFWGVRGSTPCDGHQFDRYGGNTSCVEIAVDGSRPDRVRSRHRPAQLRRRARGRGPPRRLPGHRAAHPSALGPHPGPPVLRAAGGGRRDASPSSARTRRTARSIEVFREVMQPALLPDHVPRSCGATVAFEAVGQRRLRRSTAPRCGRAGCATPTPPSASGSRCEGVSVAYLSDHGPGTVPDDADDYVPDDVLELCDGVDLLIHDAQHTAEEYEIKRTWGHCTIEYAIHVAKEAGARQLGAVPPLPVARRRRASTPSSATRASRRRGSAGPRCSRPPTACGTRSARRCTADQRARNPRGACVARRAHRDRHRSRRRAVPVRPRPLRDRRHHHHRASTTANPSAWRRTRSRRCRSTRR